MSHSGLYISNENGESKIVRPISELSSSYNYLEQQVYGTSRLLSVAEENIIQIIDSCLKSWYKRWIDTYFEDKREFRIVYDLMEGLLHYEYQITNSENILSSDRTNAIAQAVARLVDYGNSLLNIDLIIRACDETSSELNPSSVTTIELFHAHIKAHNLREKLLYDYFKKDKPSPTTDDTYSISSGTIPLVTLQPPSNSQQPYQSPVLERSHRSSVGSSTSINTLSDGRRTPQPILSQIELQAPPSDLNSFSVEIAHMMATIRSSAFSSIQNSAPRLTLLPGLLSKIESLMSVPSNYEKVTTCFELLDALFESIEKLPTESRTQEVTAMRDSLLKPLVRKVYIDDRDSLVDFQHAHWTTCLLSMTRLMTASDFNNYMKNFINLADLSAFLKDYLFIVKRIMSTSNKTTTQVESDSMTNYQSVYPDCWIEMVLLSCSIFLKSLTCLYHILRQYFSSNLQMWSSYIECLLHFILRDALSPDRFMLKVRQSLLAQDLRQTAAEYVRLSWESLNREQKQQLLEDLIDPLLRASMILHSKQRSIILPIFYDMMRCDYTSQYITSRGSDCSSSTLCSRGDQAYSNFIYDEDLESLPPTSSQTNSMNIIQTNESLPYLSFNEVSDDGTVLKKFTHLIVGKLNTLMIDLTFGDDLFRDEFCAAISGDSNSKYHDLNARSSSSSIDTSQFKSMARHTSDLIAEFIQICLDARQANKLSYKHLYLLCLFKLILFFRDKVDRVELYLGYLYKLCYLHHTAARYVEAGHTLLEHAKSLPWSDRPLESHHRIVTRFFQTSQPLNDYSSLKVFLYNTIIEYFDKGQLWEAAVPLCRELVDVYQIKTYEYGKLAQILQKMSIYFNNIVEPGLRSDPEYFRVTFYGSGFPMTLKNTTMVYRGKPYEKLGDFQNTMLSKYPDANLLNSLSKPDEKLLNEPGARYLQINACSPVIDLKLRFRNDLTKVEEPILNYYRHNECDKFNFSRKISRPDYLVRDQYHEKATSSDNFADIWRERTILTTNTLPNMLPFFPVYLIETKVVSPIESAIEDLERTNDRLSSMVNRFKADKRQAEDVRLLGQLLLGVVDAAVNGGITKYEEAFFTSQPTKPSKIATTSTTSGLESNLGSLHLSSCLINGEASHSKQQAELNEQHSSKLVADVDRPSGPQVDKLKCLIAGQVPLLDEAIRLHRDRVADIMRPQHEHLEASYKELKRHIMTKYSRYLPSDYNRSTLRPYRSLARSPNRSVRLESRGPLLLAGGSSGSNASLANRFALKRMSDVGNEANNDQCLTSCNIPYRQLNSERRSLPFLTDNHSVTDRDMVSGVAMDNLRQAAHESSIGLESDKEATSLNHLGYTSDELPTMLDQVNRPIPAMRASINMKDGAVYTDESRLAYTRFVGEDNQANDQLAASERRRENSETEACLLVED